MLKELSPKAVSFDTHTDSTVVTLEGTAGGGPSSSTATLLVDAEGRLVGVDLRAGLGGCVVMLGAHEDVARTLEGAKVAVTLGRDGNPTEVRIRGHRARGAEMSIL